MLYLQDVSPRYVYANHVRFTPVASSGKRRLSLGLPPPEIVQKCKVGETPLFCVFIKGQVFPQHQPTEKKGSLPDLSLMDSLRAFPAYDLPTKSPTLMIISPVSDSIQMPRTKVFTM